MLEWVGSSIWLGYLGIFLGLLLCGLGLPLPEDILLITAGYLTYIHGWNLYGMVLVALSGVLIGDATIFWLGRRFGREIVNVRLFNRWMSPKRIEKTERFFERYGEKTVFFARFLPGLRAPTYLIAGTMRFDFPLFLLLDGLAALISVPTVVYLAFHFGDDIAAARTHIRKVIYGAALLVLLYILVEIRRRRRKPI
ncbi:MAG: DedA family protein [Deltaproteobacteria bacterium]|nr:MAG: DedA family protein [Deltaproteobacteria bacterium]